MKWKIQFAHCIFILYVRCTCDFLANALSFKTIFQLAPDVVYFSCDKKVYLPYNFFSPLPRQVSVIVIVGYWEFGTNLWITKIGQSIENSVLSTLLSPLSVSLRARHHPT